MYMVHLASCVDRWYHCYCCSMEVLPTTANRVIRITTTLASTNTPVEVLAVVGVGEGRTMESAVRASVSALGMFHLHFSPEGCPGQELARLVILLPFRVSLIPAMPTTSV